MRMRLFGWSLILASCLLISLSAVQSCSAQSNPTGFGQDDPRGSYGLDYEWLTTWKDLVDVHNVWVTFQSPISPDAAFLELQYKKTLTDGRVIWSTIPQSTSITRPVKGERYLLQGSTTLAERVDITDDEGRVIQTMVHLRLVLLSSDGSVIWSKSGITQNPNGNSGAGFALHWGGATVLDEQDKMYVHWTANIWHSRTRYDSHKFKVYGVIPNQGGATPTQTTLDINMGHRQPTGEGDFFWYPQSLEVVKYSLIDDTYTDRIGMAHHINDIPLLNDQFADVYRQENN